LTRKNTGHSPQSKHQIVNDVMHKLVLEVKDVEVEGKGRDSSENIQLQQVETRPVEALDEVVQRDKSIINTAWANQV
jgi:hypothetical protein